MPLVKCEITENNQLIKTSIIKTSDDMVFYFDMFEGKRYIDITEQYNNLINCQETSNQLVYELYCSYLKFGEIAQEIKKLTVTLHKGHSKLIRSAIAK